MNVDVDPGAMDRHVDGNAAGGLLHSVFPFEMTLATVTCDGCGGSAPMATLAVYLDAPGVIVRCPSCEAVILRIAEGNGQYWLDLRGTRVMQITIDS
jgi:hypothetical protein